MALNKTAYSKRVEQLKRYEDSETNRESVSAKNANARKVRFSAGCIFLAACASGDKDEVLNMLNSVGADIDTANVDGLTALHQVNIAVAQPALGGGSGARKLSPRGIFISGEKLNFCSAFRRLQSGAEEEERKKVETK